MSKEAFQGHIDDMLKDYNRMIIVNLVKENKTGEFKLLTALQNQLLLQPNKNVKHKWFDFHGETHGDNFHKVNDLMEDLKGVQNKFSYFKQERYGDKKVIQL